MTKKIRKKNKNKPQVKDRENKGGTGDEGPVKTGATLRKSMQSAGYSLPPLPLAN